MRIKRIFSILLIVILLLQVCYALPKDIDDVPYSVQIHEEERDLIADSELTSTYNLLHYLGIVTTEKSNLNPSDKATKGLAAEYFAKMVYGGLMSSNESIYADVPAGNIYAEGVYTAASLGIISKEDDRFYPSKVLSLEDAAGMAVCALKYDIIMGNMPPLAFAITRGIFDNIDLKTKEVSIGQLMRIIENTMKANSVNINGISSGDGDLSVTIDSGKDFLYEKKGIKLQEGIVTGVGNTSIFGDIILKENEIEINRSVFKLNIAVDSSLVGCAVYAYVDTNDDKNLIIDIWKNNRKNDVLQMESEQLVNVTGNRLTYQKDGKDIKITLNMYAKVLYNNAYYGVYEMALNNNIISCADQLVLIDNDGDLVYDIIKISKYSYYMVSKVSTYSGIVSFMYNKGNLDTKDDNNICNFVMEDKNIMPTELKQRDVLSVLEADRSDGRKIYNIIISRNSISGMIEAITDMEDGAEYVIDGIPYRLTDAYKEYLLTNTSESKPQIGQEAEFMLSHDNKIVGSMADSEFTFGFMMNASATQGVAANCEIMVYSLKGIKNIYKLKDKIVFYNKDNINGTRMSAITAMSHLYADNKLNNSMIGYIIEEDGEISELALPLDTTLYPHGTIDYPLTCDYSIYAESTSENARIYRNVFARKYSMTNNLPIIMYPGDESLLLNEKAYQIKSGGSWGTENYFKQELVTLYNVNKFYVPQFAAVKGAAGNLVVDREMHPVIIDSVVQGVSDDETLTKITYRQNKNIISSFVSADAEIISDGSAANGTAGKNWFGHPDNISELSKGDIIQFETDGLGQIKLIRVLFKMNNRPPFGVQTVSSIGSISKEADVMTSLTLIYGIVDDIDGAIMLVNTSDSGKDPSHIYPVALGHSVYGAVYYILFDTSTNKTMGVDRDEIQSGDTVVMRKYYNHVCDVYIIR